MKKLFLLGAMVCALGMMTACKRGSAIKNIDETLLIGRWCYSYGIVDGETIDDSVSRDTLWPGDNSSLIGIEFTESKNAILTQIELSLDSAGTPFSYVEDTVSTSCSYSVSRGTITIEKLKADILRLTPDTLITYSKQNNYNETSVFVKCNKPTHL